MSRIPRVPIAIATAAAVLTTGLVVLFAASDATAAPNTPSFNVVSRTEPNPSYRSAISSDGNQVAYQTLNSDRSVIRVRDVYSLDSVELPHADTSATTPSMSGDAGLVSFLGDRQGGTLESPEDQQIYVVNRRDASNPTVKAVTDTPNDLPYQRVVRCAINGGDGDDEGCEPKLSRDGQTLVAPVYQSIDAPRLELSVDGESLDTDRGLEPLMDLGAFEGSAESQLTVKNISTLPIVYPETGPTIEGDANFVVSANTCANTLQPGASCVVTVKFTRNADCNVEADATLRLPAAIAAGQTAIKLTGGGECPRLAAFPPAQAEAATADCTGESQYKWGLPVAEAPQTSEGRPHSFFPIGSVRAGELGIAAVAIRNSMGSPHIPTLSSSGCQLKFVLPATAEAGACVPGQPIAPEASCTAYVEYLVPQVAPFSGTFHAGDSIYRVSGHATRAVIAAWRDASATGNFGAAQVVSVTGSGNAPMDGTGPTVSADGRWIGYASDTALGRPATDPNAAQSQSQVYLHDTDAAGDGSHKSGQTVLVSLKADGSLPMTADTASVSDDGTRVAFRSWEPVTGAPNQDHFMQVYVRDRVGERSILASAGPDGTSANDWTHSPELSGDGYTVVYRSNASNLGGGDLAGTRIIARDLTKDLAGARSSNELVSVREGSAGTQGGDRFQSVNQNGTQVAFVSTDSFDTYDQDSSSDVYHARRAGSVSLEPAELDFGQVPVRTPSGARPVTMTNNGQTVVQFDNPYAPESGEFQIVGDQCSDKPIRPGQTCSYTVEFTPKYVGTRAATLTAFDFSGAATPSLDYKLTGRGTSDARTTGETSQLSTNDGAHLDPAISDNGQFVAYRTSGTGADDSPTSIWTRNQATNDIRQTSGTEHLRVGPPDISADGNRVAYNAVDSDHQDGEAAHTWVADRSAPAATQHYVTGTETDLRYQRPGRCEGNTIARACRPSLSGDGKTVAFPARLATTGAALDLQLVNSDPPNTPVESLIDFGTGINVQHLQVKTYRPMRFTGPPTIEGASAFTVGTNTCTGELEAGGTCQVDINYSSCSPATAFGVLRLPGATPDGQTAVSLVGNGGCLQLKKQEQQQEAAAACEPIPAPGRSPLSSSATTNDNWPLADAGDMPVGYASYTALEVKPLEGSATLFFDSGCDFALVTPPDPEPDRPRPCVDGETLPAGTACTAYVGFRPGAVGPSVANLAVEGNDVGGLYRFSGRGYQDVVLARADTKADGTYAGASEIISKGSAGQTIIGNQPSLSGDGRYVAFVSSEGPDRAAGDHSTQVYRHDRTTGQTVRVSKPVNTGDDWDDTSEPSISRAGDRVAFITNGYVGDGDEEPSQVWARDITAEKTVLVSAAQGSASKVGDSWSRWPSLSDDGSTVGFESSSTDLIADPGNAHDSVYVRYLEPDFDGAPAAQRFTERVALTAEGAAPEDEGSSGAAALSADGAFTAFDSGSKLVASDTDNYTDVYVRRRPAQLVVEPAAVDFGGAKVGTMTAARQLTVRNIGMGPAAAGPATTGSPFDSGSNLCNVTLHRGESCVIDATFKPTTPGPANGLLTLPSRQGYLAGPSVSAALTGTGTTVPPAAGFSAVPGKLVFPARELGESGPPLKVTLRNTGEVPLTVKATLASPDFGTAEPSACASLMPGAACEFPVLFSPRAVGARTASIVFQPTSQDPAVKSPAPVTVALAGQGSPGPAVASMTVAPRTLIFGTQVLLSNSAPKSIVVTNTGTVPLNVTGVSANADFTSLSACRGLLPGKQCSITVRFVPRALGVRFGAVQVTATAAGVAAPFPVSVGLRGTTATPVLTVEPPVVRPGQIVVATGTNFPPGRPVVLAWKTGLGSQQVVADSTGRFQTAVLVFRRDVLGQRLLSGTIPGQALVVESPTVLVMPLSPQPPNFVLRW